MTYFTIKGTFENGEFKALKKDRSYKTKFAADRRAILMNINFKNQCLGFIYLVFNTKTQELHKPELNKAAA